MRAHLLAPVAAVVLLLAACGGASAGPDAQETGVTSTPEASPTASGTSAGQDDPTITVRAAGGAWLVRGSGFTGGNQYLVQCTGGTTEGASALDDCDMSTSEQVVADGRGRISATRQARAFVNVGANVWRIAYGHIEAVLLVKHFGEINLEVEVDLIAEAFLRGCKTFAEFAFDLLLQFRFPVAVCLVKEALFQVFNLTQPLRLERKTK